jgi:peptidoglycan biosynthesis protein MviN/MurJ (putative lipid II flippase)
VLLAPVILSITVTGFRRTRRSSSLTVLLAQIMFPFILLCSLARR